MNEQKISILIRKYFPDFFYLNCLFLVYFMFLSAKRAILDFDLSDESIHLHGLISFKNGADPAWGPIYSIFYWIQHFWQKDLVKLYYQNAYLITILLPVSFYCFLRSYGFHSYFSGLFGFLLLVSDYNFFIFPKAAHFQLILIFMYLSIARRERQETSYLILITIFSLFLMYIRPKMIIVPLILVILLGAHLFRQKEINWVALKSKIMPGSCGLILFLLLAIQVGNPLGNHEKNAAVYKINFELNRAEREALQGYPLTTFSSSPLGIVQEAFAHIRHNIRNMGYVIFNHEFNFPSGSVFHTRFSMDQLQVALILFGVAVVVFLQRKKRLRRFNCSFYYYFPIIHSLLCLVTSAIIYAWPRFLLATLLFFPLLFTAIFGKKSTFQSSLVFCFLFFIQAVLPFTLNSSDKSFIRVRESGIEASLSLANSVRGLPKGKCLSYPHYAGYYLSSLCAEVFYLKEFRNSDGLGIWQQVKELRPDYVFIGESFWQPSINSKNLSEQRRFSIESKKNGFRDIMLSLNRYDILLVSDSLTNF